MTAKKSKSSCSIDMDKALQSAMRTALTQEVKPIFLRKIKDQVRASAARYIKQHEKALQKEIDNAVAAKFETMYAELSEKALTKLVVSATISVPPRYRRNRY